MFYTLSVEIVNSNPDLTEKAVTWDDMTNLQKHASAGRAAQWLVGTYSVAWKIRSVLCIYCVCDCVVGGFLDLFVLNLLTAFVTDLGNFTITVGVGQSPGHILKQCDPNVASSSLNNFTAVSVQESLPPFCGYTKIGCACCAHSTTFKTLQIQSNG